MKKTNLTLVLLLFFNSLYSQNQTNNWYFGWGAGITFNTNPPTMLTGGQLITDEGCASISDSNGNLLFYSNGVKVWDSTHAIMPNGTGLLGHVSTTQSCIILPAPGNATLYYIITAPYCWGSDPLAYSVVDMTLNNGLGDVTVKNDTLIAAAAEKLTAVLHANGTDIWIIAHGDLNNNFYAFLLTGAGINPVPVVSLAGSALTNVVQKAGCLKASPDGTQLAMAIYGTSTVSTLELFDFNNLTGTISNSLVLGQWTGYGVYGVEFSPNNSKLYASTVNPGIVVQFDLSAGSPSAIIASMDTIATLSFPAGNRAIQTGSDGKIYLTNYADSSLACITNPNQQGSLCGYVLHYIALSATGRFGLPGFLTSWFNNIPSGINSASPVQAISVYPNPFMNNVSVTIRKQQLKQVTFTIKNIFGQTVLSKEENNLSNIYTKIIDLSFLSKGIYLIDVIIDGDRTVKKIVKE